MVKNFGGNRAKRQARKHVTAPRNTKLRTSKYDGELYAVVIKMLGGPNMLVHCIDGKERICIIRKKFSGRNKRDNILAHGTWVLVGLRDFETSKPSVAMNPSTGSVSTKNKEKCDLLEVYRASDIENLKRNEDIDFLQLSVTDEEHDIKSEIQFVDEKTMEYQEMMENTDVKRIPIASTDSNNPDTMIEIDEDDI
jgi:initiation factor 1A